MSFSAIPYLTKPKPGVMLNPLHPLSRGLVGYWLFNEGSGSRANDISGHGNHGTLMNMSPNVQGSGWGGSKFGGGLKFDGANDYVDAGNDASLDFTDEFSFSAIIKTNTISDGYKNVMIHRKEASNGVVIGLWLSNADIYYEVRNDNRSSSIGGNIGVSLNTNTWYHIVLAITSSGSVDIYVNGTKYNIVSDINGPWTNCDNPLEIGRHKSSSNPTGAQFFNGSIDSVKIYNRALSAAEVKQLYEDPFCNLLRAPVRYVPAAPPVGAIMNQFQNFNIGADLYNGAIIA